MVPERDTLTRVGFILTHAATGWLGGAQYYRNLFAALHATPEANVEGYVFHDSGAPVSTGWARKAIRLRILEERSIPWLVRSGVTRILDSDVLLERRLEAEGVEVISHAHVGRTRRLPAIAWIPDVQHRHLPALFTARDRAIRDRIFASAARSAAIVLASSESARSDVEEFYPESRGRVRVLRFVHCSSPAQDPVPPGIAEGHRIREPFVLLPNQFWVHKNHEVVVEALRILRGRGKRVVVLCTGNTSDFRNPDHFRSLQGRIAEAGVSEDMRILGLVSYGELAFLMRAAVAILNPSLFEGWSTTVEEAKTLGKKVILSSISVHREQAPERATYFDPHDAEALAAALYEATGGCDPEEERRSSERSARALPARRSAFAHTYAAIAREARALGARRD